MRCSESRPAPARTLRPKLARQIDRQEQLSIIHSVGERHPTVSSQARSGPRGRTRCPYHCTRHGDGHGSTLAVHVTSRHDPTGPQRTPARPPKDARAEHTPGYLLYTGWDVPVCAGVCCIGTGLRSGRDAAHRSGTSGRPRHQLTAPNLDRAVDTPGYSTATTPCWSTDRELSALSGWRSGSSPTLARISGMCRVFGRC